MLIFDLKLTIFLLIALLAAAAGGAVWLDRARTRRNHAGMEDAPFGVVSFNPAGKVQTANLAAQRLLGARAGSVPSLPEAEADSLLVDLEAAGGHYRLIAVPPDRWLRVWRSADGKLALLFDATDPQRAAQASQRLLNDLSHELRTPLATILTHAEVQGLAGLSDVTRAESLGLLKEETQRAIRLVNSMLELGRLETSAELPQRPLDMLPIAELAIQQSMPEATLKGIVLRLEADTPLPTISGNADALLRVLLNLLDNAVKYGRTGDWVALSLRGDPAGLHCMVSDSGPGIAARHLPYLTQRFYRAAPLEQAGSGLGLALVQEILRQHGSALQIESETEGSNTGTRVSFVLPARAPAGGAR